MHLSSMCIHKLRVPPLMLIFSMLPLQLTCWSLQTQPHLQAHIEAFVHAFALPRILFLSTLSPLLLANPTHRCGLNVFTTLTEDNSLTATPADVPSMCIPEDPVLISHSTVMLNSSCLFISLFLAIPQFMGRYRGFCSPVFPCV